LGLGAKHLLVPERANPANRAGDLRERLDHRYDKATEPIAGTFDTGCLLPDVRGACD
jgi:hypothetical protein